MPSPLESFPNSFQVTAKALELPDELIAPLAERLKVEKRVILRYRKKQKYPLAALKELSALTGKNILETIWRDDTEYFVKWKKITLPSTPTPKLAYFAGYLQGDGYMGSNCKRIEFADEYREQIERMNAICHELFGIQGKICILNSTISKKPYYCLTIGSSIINSYLHIVFSINRGTKKNLRVPESIKKEKEILKWYLAGLFDADGTFPKHPKKCKQIFLDITFKDKAFIEEIREQLNRFGVITLDPRCRKAKSPNTPAISET